MIYKNQITNKDNKKFAKVITAQPDGLSGEKITVEIDISRGIYSFVIIGLADKSIEESRDRVTSAIKHSGFPSPKRKNQKIIVSLAPADKKKEGSMFDVAISVAYLQASGFITNPLKDKVFIGELSLDGQIKSVRGLLCILKYLKSIGVAEVYVPIQNTKEASLIDGMDIYPVSSLSQLVSHLNNETPVEKLIHSFEPGVSNQHEDDMLFEDIKGQEFVKRALTIAASGSHNIMLYGPPGTGKTLLAKALRSILPPLTKQEIIETTSIYSISGELSSFSPILFPPFRSPHHTSSYVSIVGGGKGKIKPGEISLANNGVLFLDEFPEFDRRVIESLREPLEEHTVTISRSAGSASYPCSVILVTALNPCPCGKKGSNQECVCLPNVLANYQKKITGPIMDRIDMWVYVDSVNYKTLDQKNKEGSQTKKARESVLNARLIQKERFQKEKITKNAEMSSRDIDNYITLEDDVRDMLHTASQNLSLSPRSYHRILKCARTIADVSRSKEILKEHVLEAIQYKENKFS